MRHHALAATRQPDVLTLGAATWLACGIVLLGLTPLPLHDAALGWSPAFWLLAAPAILLVARRATAPVRERIPVRRPTRTPAHDGVQAVRHRRNMAIAGRRERHRAQRSAA